jgi:hypothetical protein
MTTVVAVLNDLCLAQRAVSDLISSGFPRNVISVVIRHFHGSTDPGSGNDDGRGPEQSVLAGGPLGEALRKTSHDESAVADALKRAGLPPSASLLFAEAVSAGSILVAIYCKEGQVRDARDILDIYAAPEPRLGQPPAIRRGLKDGTTTLGRSAADAARA